jgi:hypothetical protein
MIEGNAPTQAALHNCGPSPREVFRCPAIGSTETIDLARVLWGWQEMPWAQTCTIVSTRVAESASPPADRDRRIAGPQFAAVCARVLECLEASHAPDAGAAALVRSVVALVLDCGWHRDMIGLAKHTQQPVLRWRAGPRWPEAPKEPVHSRDVALAIAAHAVYTPPLLLWTRVPSLDWLRCDIVLAVRCPWQSGAR